MRLAVVIITKDEERNIEACLDSVRWADEVVVVDACSTDRTADLARARGARVFVRPWPGYGPQKNFGMDQATADWILIVDADERVTESLRDEIARVLAEAPPADLAGYEVPRRNFFYGRWLRGGGTSPDHQLRLFRRTSGRYDEVLLHENLHLDGRTARLTQPLDHHSMPDICAHVRKIVRYTTLGAQEKLKRRSRVTTADLLGSHLATILRLYLWRGGWRDGVPGLIFALFSGMHTFVKYAKAYERLLARGEGRDAGGAQGS